MTTPGVRCRLFFFKCDIRYLNQRTVLVKGLGLHYQVARIYSWNYFDANYYLVIFFTFEKEQIHACINAIAVALMYFVVRPNNCVPKTPT